MQRRAGQVTWRPKIIEAMKHLGRPATEQEITDTVFELFGRADDEPKDPVKVVRNYLKDACPDFHHEKKPDYKKRDDFRGEGTGRERRWWLKDATLPAGPAGSTEHQCPHPAPAEIAPQETRRVSTVVERIVRDTELILRLKALHADRCQLCNETLTLCDGRTYSEGHHVMPLGSPHNGPDVAENVLILCPNCHAKCDLFGVEIDASAIRIDPEHGIDPESIRYHNERVRGRAVSAGDVPGG